MKSDTMRISDFILLEMVLAKEKSNKNNKTLNISELHSLIKQGENADFKSMVKNIRASDLVDIRGTTLLHVAAKCNNVEVIEYLLTSECDIDAKTSRGTTPLLTAALHNNFESVQLLLGANADILIPDASGKTTLQVLLQENRGVPEYVIASVFARLKKSVLGPDKIAEVLIQAGCTIDRVLLMNDPEVTRVMLNLTDLIGENEARLVLQHAMESGTLENVEVLLHHGVGANARRRIFLNKLMADSEDFSMRPYIENLVDWDVIDEEFVQFLEETFVAGNKHIIRMWLNYGLDEHVWDKFGRELAVNIFENPMVDPTALMQKIPFVIDAPGKFGRTALHFSVMRQSLTSIQFLLDRGANPNCPDEFGNPPLFYAKDEECVQRLLSHGADPQLIHAEKRATLERNGDLYSELDFMLAHLAILDAQGASI
ncbi:putative ankyrin repeat protein RF_0381 [Phymastichus coffea]|uniref:putative ankyrin repeat protein RF_0381 n=1 Tax=Phymastichus coffea TaxID=108790 RepID=UPI00273CE6C1|nr:putative ankyrin repeat protein RF_0381 [Phymastichus coffea]XP_058795049.1 putative ankyrin repeat protein RF_0381 [Phymastichus coffea]XP_058795050.1 putative ankyrin repeat protein RF_0381 [Phymastichus coffea]XP_058795051.1 putative ankyrin repeat protein RF_0381 [Phymastichus coffea]XP_058795053.1 putative ankyrin repeat protein RF_0381 [Phymastichus coffea]XP_058795054.1 putative ankyrin repeat protein RF_0381 [Phymastichus coffea]XP_058809681.1 putative ankyrin repeat protein RF_038